MLDVVAESSVNFHYGCYDFLGVYLKEREEIPQRVVGYGCFEEGSGVDQSDGVVRHVAPAGWANQSPLVGSA